MKKKIGRVEPSEEEWAFGLRTRRVSLFISWKAMFYFFIVLSCIVSTGFSVDRTAPPFGGEFGTDDRLSKAYAHFVAGLLARSEGQEEKAYSEFLQAALLDPANVALVVDVGRYYLQAGDPKTTLRVISTALEKGVETPAVKELEALAFLQLGRTNRALSKLRTLVHTAPHYWSGYKSLCFLAAHVRNYRLAEATLDKATSVFATNVSGSLLIAETWIDYGRLRTNRWIVAKRRAADLLNRINELDVDAYTASQIGELFAALGDYSAAFRWYTNLLSRPGLNSPLKELIPLRVLAYGRRLSDTNAWYSVFAQLRQMAATDAKALFNLALVCNEYGDHTLAVDLLEQAIALSPGFETAYYELARTKLEMLEPNSALAVLESARERFGITFGTEFLSGLALAMQKDYTNALRFFMSAEVIATTAAPDRTNEMLCFHLGSAYERVGNYAQAEQYLKMAINLNPDFDEALNYLGYMWAELGTNLVEAYHLIERALELEPNNAAYLDSMGWVLFKLGKPKQALKYLEKAALLSTSSDPEIYDHLGEVYYALGRFADAVKTWRRALLLGGSDAIADKIEKVESRRRLRQ